MQKKTLAKEKHTSRSRSTPDRRRANTHPAALFPSLGTCARKLAFAQTVRACAVGLAARPLAALRKFRRLRCGLWRLVRRFAVGIFLAGDS
ncbi:MAG: hypothetical protein PUB85_07940 [Clostridia bacterium]|nr:hypothetical protein [Clostridia bacterium]